MILLRRPISATVRAVLDEGRHSSVPDPGLRRDRTLQGYAPISATRQLVLYGANLHVAPSQHVAAAQRTAAPVGVDSNGRARAIP